MDGRDAMLAVSMNGEPLPFEHGFPVRMIVPGLYGYVSATKWLVDIELTTFDAYDAYWIQRGWAQQAPVKTQSRIDTPALRATLARRHRHGGRRRVGAAPRHRARRGAGRRRPVGGRRPRGRGHGRHVAAVGVPMGRDIRDRTPSRSGRPTATVRRRPPTASLRSRTARPAITRSSSRSPRRSSPTAASVSRPRAPSSVPSSSVGSDHSEVGVERDLDDGAVIEADLHAVGRTIVSRLGLDHGRRRPCARALRRSPLERGAGERLSSSPADAIAIPVVPPDDHQCDGSSSDPPPLPSIVLSSRR